MSTIVFSLRRLPPSFILSISVWVKMRHCKCLLVLIFSTILCFHPASSASAASDIALIRNMLVKIFSNYKSEMASLRFSVRSAEQKIAQLSRDTETRVASIKRDMDRPRRHKAETPGGSISWMIENHVLILFLLNFWSRSQRGFWCCSASPEAGGNDQSQWYQELPNQE